MKTTLLPFLLFFFWVYNLSAQDTLGPKKIRANYELDHPFIVDRPGVADMPYTVAPRHFQFCNGFDFINRGNWNGLQLPSFLFRTGITHNTELRVGIKNLFVDTTANDLKYPYGYQGGTTPISLGLKVVLLREKGIIPQVALMTDIILPFTSAPIYKNSYSGHDLYLLFLNNFTKKLFINYNVGVIWDNGPPIWALSFCLEYQATKQLGFFIEQYDYLPEQEVIDSDILTEIAIDGGITYLIAPKVQFDCSAGYSKTNDRDNYFIGTGISFRIDPPYKKR